MPQITLLSQETIDKIAAGEVVERPSSVVKELVENAIDAKATAVTVEIKEGGISFIRITDNGCGIEREQVPLAFLRHSTSKIKSVEDLMCIRSLGFRGEALSSIAAVSQVELITKTYGELTGTRYVIEGSKEKENEEVGAPDGTTFIVRNLFYNTPARRKFLKTAQTEGNYIGDLMERLALSHPDVSFKFISNGQTKLHTSGNSNEKDMIYHIYGRDITASILPVNAENELFKVKGFIGKPMVSRGNRNYENYFINGRYIKSALLSKAVEEAYKGFMMQHQYPFCVLYVTMDTDLLDVNVHPTKMELRFSNNEEIYRRLYQIIRDTLTHKEFIPDVPVDAKREERRVPLEQKSPEPFEKRRIQELRSSVAKDSPYEQKYPARDRLGVTAESQKLPKTTIISESQEILKTPGSVQDTLPQKPTEQAENLDVFKKLLASSSSGRKEEYKRNEKSADVLCEPSTYHVELERKNDDTIRQEKSDVTETPIHESAKRQSEEQAFVYEQQTLMAENKEFLTPDAAKKHRIIGQLFDTYWLIEYEDKLFIIDQHAAHEKVLYERTMARVRKQDFSSQTISPPIILTLSLEEQEMLEKYEEQIKLFGYEVEPFGGKEYAINAIPAEFEGVDMKSMFVDMLDDFTNINSREAPELILEKVASLSCKAAIKGGNHISRAEAEQLIDELLTLENPYHCPHGRPTIISMNKYEIEKKFKRIV
ncbi:MAG: DNA mismatch repair endonuclease MutL [Clostridiales bacterium]|nr:DNA mismatch repair endonuclease MutL [Roseburia sp.]MDD7638210.1 DNA mismatch repair endonuclease MutL [Clostridiales bacterium]MDY4114018.1 DNA mismatch repair endonuclease MutL [Roseburia sp.]